MRILKAIFISFFWNTCRYIETNIRDSMSRIYEFKLFLGISWQFYSAVIVLFAVRETFFDKDPTKGIVVGAHLANYRMCSSFPDGCRFQGVSFIRVIIHDYIRSSTPDPTPP